MPLSDDELLDFDHKRLADFDLSRARKTLAEQPEAYRAQLVAARWIDGWRQRAAERNVVMPHSDEWHEAFDEALREVVAHLRQGDLKPRRHPSR